MDPRHPRLAPPPWRHDWFVLRALRRRIEILVDGLSTQLPEAPTLVDYGAGDAPYEPLFVRHWPPLRYLKCDLGPGAEHPLDDDGRIGLPDGIADLVVSFQVLEHVRDVELYLSECRRLLRPGGRLLLSTHGTWLFHPHPTDFRRWTREGLILDLANGGLRVTEIHGLVGPLAWTTLFRLLGYRGVLMRLPWLGALASALLGLVMNARMVVEEAITPESIVRDNAAVYVLLAEPMGEGWAADARASR